MWLPLINSYLHKYMAFYFLASTHCYAVHWYMYNLYICMEGQIARGIAGSKSVPVQQIKAIHNLVAALSQLLKNINVQH